jgi:hypothetical protein
MHSEQEWWSVEDLLLDETQGHEQDKAFSALLRQRMKRGKRDDSRDNEKLKRNKRRVK